MGKIQVLSALALLLVVYSVHATVYFREEFSDGGKFGLDISDSKATRVIYFISLAC